MKIEKLVAHIPARAGSKRLKSKNLRMLNGKPMIGYAIDCAKQCPEIDAILVNTDSQEIAEYAESMGVGVFHRAPELATDTSTGDDFTYDIIKNLDLQTLLMVSPVCPLVTPTDVRNAIKAYVEDGAADTLISCTETKMQTAVQGRFVNIDPAGPLAPTQVNPTVQICNWAVTIWNGPVFLSNYEKFAGGYCGTRRVLFAIDPLNAVKVSDEADFHLVSALLRAREDAANENAPPRFWSARCVG